MAKRKTWFTILKRLFVSEPRSNLEKKEKRKRWVFRLLKMRDFSAGQPPPKERLQWLSTTAPQTTQQTKLNATHRQFPCNQPQVRHGDWDLAAIKIQAAFRGYLGRKALRALKGVVKLQALIRGWAVRQQAINTLKCLQSIVDIQTKVCSKRCENSRDSLLLHCQEHNHPRSHHHVREKDIKVDLNSQKRWDDSTLTRDELKAVITTKKEASMKRERIREYYLNHRRSAETERDRAYGRPRYWLEQWVDAQLAKTDNPRNQDDRRTYHHRKQRSIGGDETSSPSITIPAYMAATESARAKARSLSSPRMRPLSFDVCSEITSPYKHKLSPISSINSELTTTSWVQRSPCLKSITGGPLKSTLSAKEIRIRGIHYHNVK